MYHNVLDAFLVVKAFKMEEKFHPPPLFILRRWHTAGCSFKDTQFPKAQHLPQIAKTEGKALNCQLRDLNHWHF